MSSNTPIYILAKELEIDSNRVILACKKLGINANGSTKRLNLEELKKVKDYFESGKNVSEEIVEIKNNASKIIRNSHKRKAEKAITYFPNRLIAKS